MTVHFAGKFKGRYETVNLCKQFGFTRVLGLTTEDASKVTCKACAKKLGVTAAPVEKKENGNVDGTCACCFSSQKSRSKTTGKMFAHGYSRPGWGWIVGGCPGDQFLPFEKSDEGTKYMLNHAQSSLVTTKAAIVSTQNAESLTIVRQVRGKYNYNTAKFDHTAVEVTVVKGGGAVKDPSDRHGISTLTFEQVQGEKVYNLTRQVKQLEEAIKFFNEKLAEFAAKVAA